MNEAGKALVRKWQSAIEGLRADVETLRDEEQDKFDNLPQGAQEGEKGQAIEAGVTELSNAVESLQNAFDSLEDAQ